MKYLIYKLFQITMIGPILTHIIENLGGDNHVKTNLRFA
jgi:hypothetical protein